MITPWGKADDTKFIADGITFYGTPSHGGIKVKAKLNHQIPEYMRKANGWYEEDCDWAIVAVVFKKYFKDQYESALDCLKNWHPDAYEQYFGCKLNTGESYIRDRK